MRVDFRPWIRQVLTTTQSCKNESLPVKAQLDISLHNQGRREQYLPSLTACDRRVEGRGDADQPTGVTNGGRGDADQPTEVTNGGRGDADQPTEVTNGGRGDADQPTEVTNGANDQIQGCHEAMVTSASKQHAFSFQILTTPRTQTSCVSDSSFPYFAGGNVPSL